MIKPVSYKKPALVVITSIQYVSGFSFFFLQGIVIHDILKKVSLHHIILVLLLMILSKSVMLLSSILQENMKKKLEESMIDHLFESYFPTTLYKDFSHRAGFIYQSLSNSIQKNVTADVTIFCNRALFSCLFFIYLLFLTYSKFFIGGFFVILVAVSAYLNQLSWGNAFNTLLAEQSQAEKTLITWAHDYFKSYKEISKTWSASITDRSWFIAIYKSYANQKEKVNTYIFKRNIIAQFLVEMPYLITSTAVFFGIYYNKLSLPFAFAWLGISQFMITAAKGLSKNGELKKIRYDSEQKIDSLLYDVKKAPPTRRHTSAIDPCKTYTVKLQNGGFISFKLSPGIYPILGDNGAGKSTFLNTIAGFDRLATLNQDATVLLLKSVLSDQQIRIIDAQSHIIECLGDFTHQLSGPLQSHSQDNILDTLHKQLLHVLSPDLAKQWIERLSNLNTTFNARVSKELSAGEKILLSFGRFWFSWHKAIKLLLIDEADSALDPSNRKLFSETLQQLQATLTILVVSHASPPATTHDCAHDEPA